MSDYHIRKIGSDDFEMLIPLMKDCFGMEVSIDYFQWKYIQNPAGSFIGFVAIKSATNEVGAYYGVIPQNLLIDGIEKTIYQSCDTMTHSNHRRQGLFRMLAKECFQFLKENNQLFVIGFGGAQSTPGLLKLGWKHVFDFKYYFKPAISCRLSFIRSFEKDNFFENNGIKNIEDFLNKIKHSPGVISSARSAKHVRWRTQNPRYCYKTTCYIQRDVVEGYVVYYIQHNKLILFDFIFNTSASEKALFWFLSKQVNKNGYKG